MTEQHSSGQDSSGLDSSGLDSSGVIVVDKPAGITSHDVVGRLRRVLGMRRVGHAGTLDPMATGVLVVGFGRATRLLTFLVGADKEYAATIRLGWSSDTDDVEGTLTQAVATERLMNIVDQEIVARMAEFTGEIQQVPSSVSAIKVNGRRAHQRVRSGEQVTLAARPVVVRRFEAVAIHRGPTEVDIDVMVSCSSGTYVRALARDLGAALGVGAHLVSLRRTRVGPFGIADAVSLADLVAADPTSADLDRLVRTPAAAAGAFLPTWCPIGGVAQDVRHGRPVAWPDAVPAMTMAIVSSAGELLAVAEPDAGRVRYLAVFAQAAGTREPMGVA